MQKFGGTEDQKLQEMVELSDLRSDPDSVTGSHRALTMPPSAWLKSAAQGCTHPGFEIYRAGWAVTKTRST